MTNRQTLSYLQSRFRSAGIQPQTKYGQNFLVDLNLVKLIARTAELSTRDVVLEVGTGMGSLTTLMAAEAGHVVTVEIDQLLAPLAEQEFADVPNVTFLRQDALKRKNQLDPTLIETVAAKVAEIPGGRLKLVSNLPYNVATPILSNLLDIEPWPTRMVATIQKELAERITAKPSTKDYSALSVWMQAQCKTEIVRVMAPTVFWPQPKVESAILDIQPQKVLRRRIQNPEFFHTLVRKIFLHRRKFLRSALVSAVKPELGKADVDEVMESLQLGSNTRAEQLSPQQLLDLSDEVHDRVKKVETSDS